MLRLIYTVGWLPALVGAGLALPGAAPVPVLSGAGTAGVRASLGLAVSLAVLGAAYAGAIRRPPARGELLAACGGSLLVALLLAALFSADAYAYAYYGDLALRGSNPYGHGPAPGGDPLAAAASAAWDGRVPPRCVYGPLAVAIAALADLGGSFAGVGGQIFAQRLAAVLAYAACIALGLRLETEPRARAALLLNPVVIWSVAEGHNDAAMLALVFAGLATPRGRPLLLALAAAVKAPAIAVLAWTRGKGAGAAVVLAAAAYVPLLFAVAQAIGTSGEAADSSAVGATAWQSPLGILAAGVGRAPASAAALLLVGAAAVAARRLPLRDRPSAIALAAWFALPNAYPWYALWIVPLAARNLRSVWSRALLAASLSGAVRAFVDAIFPAANPLAGIGTFHGEMIALEFVPPLLVLIVNGLGRRAIVSTATIAALALFALPAGAQALAPSPQPNPAPRPQTSTSATGPAQAPTPAPAGPAAPSAVASATPAAPAAGSSANPAPAAQTPPAAPPTPQQATPAPQPATPSPQAATAAPVPSAAAPAPAPAPTVNPFTYIITPTPTPVTSPDGPHILQVDLNDRHIRAGGPLLVRVFTSPNVVGVEARALGRFIPIPQNSPGLFSLAYVMPGGIPFWLLDKSYDIVIAAATADGRQTTVSFSMILTR